MKYLSLISMLFVLSYGFSQETPKLEAYSSGPTSNNKIKATTVVPELKPMSSSVGASEQVKSSSVPELKPYKIEVPAKLADPK